MAPTTRRPGQQSQLIALQSPKRSKQTEVWDPPRTRWLLRWVQKNKGKDGPLIKDHSSAYSNAASHLQLDIPRHEPVTAKQVAAKVNAIAKRHFRIKKATQRLFLVSLEGLDKDVLRKENVYTSDEISNWPPSPMSDRPSETPLDVEGDDPSQNPAFNEELASLSQLDGDGMTIFGAPSFKDLADMMSSLSFEIETSVQTYLEAAGMDTNSATQIQPDAICEPLSTLLRRILNCDNSGIKQRLEELDAMQRKQTLELDTFVRGIVGCAVTTWVFEDDLMPEAESRMLELSRSALADEFPLYAEWHKSKVISAYLATVPPADIADPLADKLSLALIPVIRRQTHATPDQFYNKVNWLGIRNMAKLSSPAPIDGIPHLHATAIPAYHQEWMGGLKQIFRLAVLMKVRMLKGRMNYRFIFPWIGQPVHADERLIGTADSSDIQSAAVTGMSLLPKIEMQNAFWQTPNIPSQGDWRICVPVSVWACKLRIDEKENDPSRDRRMVHFINGVAIITGQSGQSGQ